MENEPFEIEDLNWSFALKDVKKARKPKPVLSGCLNHLDNLKA